jgi:hypothetical protein
MDLERIRDNAPRPLEVSGLDDVITVRDITDGERSDIANEVNKERRSKILELCKEFKNSGIDDNEEILREEIDLINEWAIGEQNRRVMLNMVVEPDLSDPEVYGSLPRKKIDAIIMKLMKEIQKEAEEISTSLRDEVKNL